LKTAIWWIRRDLRLADNLALHTALSMADQVIPTFVIDDVLLSSPYTGSKRLSFLFGGLSALDEALKERKSRLILRQGEPTTELAKLVDETNAGAVVAEMDSSPYAKERDGAATKRLPMHWVSGLSAIPPELVRKRDGEAYTVFTPFSRTWKSQSPSHHHEAAPQVIPSPDSIQSQPIPTPQDRGIFETFPPGEREANRRLRQFHQGEDAPIYRYKQLRDRIDLEGTSRLSPYIRFGMLSTRGAVNAALKAIEDAPSTEAAESAETWLNQLIWRDFFIAILDNFPFVRRVSFREKLRKIRWRNDEAEFAAWREGRTGYPIVDAAMRQLYQTGWMHNRARMIVGSFLVKDLLIDWRWGERWFMQRLVDGDPAANNGGWQWVAGTGTDAAPYFRVFNPTLQGKKFDMEGTFIRRWIPELANVHMRYIHEPWKMPQDVQESSSCAIGEDYPKPIVDHAAARQRALLVYKSASS
jgi:deoxyribodipyrimidine photo-lyase